MYKKPNLTNLVNLKFKHPQTSQSSNLVCVVKIICCNFSNQTLIQKTMCYVCLDFDCWFYTFCYIIIIIFCQKILFLHLLFLYHLLVIYLPFDIGPDAPTRLHYIYMRDILIDLICGSIGDEGRPQILKRGLLLMFQMTCLPLFESHSQVSQPLSLERKKHFKAV